MNRLIRHQSVPLAISLLVGLSAPLKALEIANQPLFLQSTADPNIMFILDDSGSMRFDYLPDDVAPSYGFSILFPEPKGVYGNGSYDRMFVTNLTGRTDSIGETVNPGLNAYIRSSYNNKQYYNPAVRYRPWKKADNSDYPNAAPSAALFHPEKSSLGGLNLTQELTLSRDSTGMYYQQSTNTKHYINAAYWALGFGNRDYSTGVTTSNSWWGPTYSYAKETFYPAIYYRYNSGDVRTYNSYTRVEIKAGNTYPGSAQRSDCANAPTCSYEEEIQNFANWFTYYRSRTLAARAGVGQAFAKQGSKMRVGYTRINSSAANGIDIALSPFEGTNRETFFKRLYEDNVPTSGTPLRRSLDQMGQYYSSSNTAGPWSATPGTASNTPFLACRQSFAVLTTDGYWSDGDSYEAKTAAARENVDGDSNSNTLADVAQYYWQTDLQPYTANKVPSNTKDTASWQHMTTFTVGLGVNGSVTPPAIPSTWPNPSNNDMAKIDDLYHAAINGHGQFFSAQDPDAFANALSATLADIADRTASASSVVTNTARLGNNSHIYQAKFSSTNWSGEFNAYQINNDGSLGDTLWSASSMFPSANDRHIYTFGNSAGIPFQWTRLTKEQLQSLNGSDNLGESRLQWLRGDQSQEQGQGGRLRQRATVLGDIINSSPVLAANESYGYSDSDYADYLRDKADRPPMLYVGANDGMLHAFDEASGIEKFAYLPAGVFSTLNDLTNPQYQHRYYVDGSPKIGDAKLGDAWKTILLGSTGAGGKSVFALDISDPANFSEQQVLWEYSGADMGYAIPQPTMAQLAGNKWVALIANGYNSTSQQASLIVLDLATGRELELLNTGEGSNSYPNGLSTPVPVDLNGDRITDYVYAGDLRGNLWRFDLRDSNQKKWTTSKIFTACDGNTCSNGNHQPITARPMVIAHPKSGVMVLFGTGSYFAVEDTTLGATPRIESLYGIWDKLDTSPALVTNSQLLAQSIVAEKSASETGLDFDVRVISNNAIDYANKRGWSLKLLSPNLNTGVGERIVADLQLRKDQLIATSMIPSTEPCDYGGKSWLMELNPINGGRLSYSVFDTNGDSNIDDNDFVTVGDETLPVSGKHFDELITRSTFIENPDGQTENKYASSSSGDIKKTLEAISPSAKGRQSWRQLQ